MGNPFTPQPTDMGIDLSSHNGTMPEFDLQNLYKGVDKYPIINKADRNDNAIGPNSAWIHTRI